MLSTRIVLDEEKILREGKYKLDELYAYLDEMAECAGLIKKDKHTYHCRGNNTDLSCLGIFTINRVVKNEAITRNVKEWWWLDNGVKDIDVISKSKSKGRGVWE